MESILFRLMMWKNTSYGTIDKTRVKEDVEKSTSSFFLTNNRLASIHHKESNGCNHQSQFQQRKVRTTD